MSFFHFKRKEMVRVLRLYLLALIFLIVLLMCSFYTTMFLFIEKERQLQSASLAAAENSQRAAEKKAATEKTALKNAQRAAEEKAAEEKKTAANRPAEEMADHLISWREVLDRAAKNAESNPQKAAADKAGVPAAIDFHVYPYPNDVKIKPYSIRIHLRADLSMSSAQWVWEATTKGCVGELYRSETFLLQGKIKNDCAKPLKTIVVKGDCPNDATGQSAHKCPAHDPQCGCHGPVMTKGMVGWAGGATGPDFFIYIGEEPAHYWAHDHTILGEVKEDSAPSWRSIKALRELPVKASSIGGMTFLQQPLKIVLSVDTIFTISKGHKENHGVGRQVRLLPP